MYNTLHKIYWIDLDIDRSQVAAMLFGVRESDIQDLAKAASADAFEEDLETEFVL